MKPTRRELLMLMAAASGCGHQADPTSENSAGAAAAQQAFRLAVCSETFQLEDFAEICRATLRTGYSGLEIAPFSLSEDPGAIPAAQRKQYRDTMQSEGVAYVGLHSLLTVPRGELHITTPDAAVRKRSWEYFRKLIDLCADLGENTVMVLGSSKQREATAGSTVEDAVKRLQEGLAEVGPQAQERGVLILLEPLAPHLCNVVTNLEQATAIVEAIGQPSVQTMFDVHNTAAETLPVGELLRRYIAHIRHVHINEMDGRRPGTGSYDYAALLQALRDVSYDGWLSLEVFHFEPSGEEVARASAEYLRRIESGEPKKTEPRA